MARSKKSDATGADKPGGDAKTQTPSVDGGGKAQPQESTLEQYDFKTGLPIDEPKPEQPDEQPTPTESGQSQGFSQADVDRILRERLERERAKFADYEKLKAAADELAQLKGKTEEEEKLLAEKLADARSKQQSMELELKEQRLRNAVLTEAASMGFSNPNDAYLLSDMAKLEMDEAGNVTGVRAVLEALQKDKPYLLRRAVPTVEPANVSRTEQQGRTDGDRFAEYFGGGHSGGFWRGGGALREVDIDKLGD